MQQSEVFEILSDAIFTVLIASSPVIFSALAIGLVIAVLQALTQIQEMTLTFVPKIACILVVFALSLPFIFSRIIRLNEKIFDILASGSF